MPFYYLEVTLPVHGNEVHQPKNTCLESGVNWQEWNRVERLEQYEFHPDLLARSKNLEWYAYLCQSNATWLGNT